MIINRHESYLMEFEALDPGDIFESKRNEGAFYIVADNAASKVAVSLINGTIWHIKPNTEVYYYPNATLMV